MNKTFGEIRNHFGGYLQYESTSASGIGCYVWQVMPGKFILVVDLSHRNTRITLNQIANVPAIANKHRVDGVVLICGAPIAENVMNVFAQTVVPLRSEGVVIVANGHKAFECLYGGFYCIKSGDWYEIDQEFYTESMPHDID